MTMKMRPKYFDIHSHLNFSQFDADREQVIAEMEKEGIWTITVGTGLKTSQESVALAEAHEGIFAAIGVHPCDEPNGVFDDVSRGALAEWEKLVKSPKVVAIGECGLDYARLSADAEQEKLRQKKLFEQQIDFAVKHGKPLMIHCRSASTSLRRDKDAHEDILEILKAKKQEFGEILRGNFHFFTSPVEVAKQILEIGFTVSFTGPITFVSEYEAIVRYVPLENMMAETDAPYAAPAPFRGRRNSPLYIKEIVKKIAQIKGEDEAQIASALVDNAFRFFL